MSVIHHVSAETLTTGRITFSYSTSPSTDNEIKNRKTMLYETRIYTYILTVLVLY